MPPSAHATMPLAEPLGDRGNGGSSFLEAGLTAGQQHQGVHAMEPLMFYQLLWQQQLLWARPSPTAVGQQHGRQQAAFQAQHFVPGASQLGLAVEGRQLRHFQSPSMASSSSPELASPSGNRHLPVGEGAAASEAAQLLGVSESEETQSSVAAAEGDVLQAVRDAFSVFVRARFPL